MDIEKRIGFISQAYMNVQNIISFADTKANISLSIQSLLISIGLGSSILANTFDKVKRLNDPSIIYVYYTITVIFIFLSIVGVIASILVYLARSPLNKNEKKRKGLLYFEHIAHFPTANEYLSEIVKIDEDAMIKEFSYQVYHLSHIAKKKMRYVNISIYLLMVNLCLTVIFIMLSGYISTL